MEKLKDPLVMWPSSAAIADHCTVYLPGASAGKVSVKVCAAFEPLSSGTGISWPSCTSFSTASCAASLNFRVSALGASDSCALSAGEELVSFACAMHGPATTSPQ